MGRPWLMAAAVVLVIYIDGSKHHLKYAFILIMNMLDLNETETTNPSLDMFIKLEYVLENRSKGCNQFETSQLI
jgi:hypothetical protein